MQRSHADARARHISNARATEALLPIWVRLYGVLKTADFNVKVVR